MTGPSQVDSQVVDGEEAVRQQLVRRVLESRHFSASARLREFLLYVTDCAIREAPADATEQQIGIRVFHRTPGFNSSEDSIVRSQARLLRLKLAAYFAEEGSGEEFVIEIPKGHYLPIFRPNPTHNTFVCSNTSVCSAQDSVSGDSSETDLLPAEPRSRRLSMQRHPFVLIIAGLGWLFALAVVLLGWRWPQSQPTVTTRFWKPFLSGDPPLVIYSNALFVGDSKSGLRYATGMVAGQSRDGPVVESYTGTGEVAAVHELTKLFDAHQSGFILKRSLLVTWDEARWKNLIFIGSTAENPSLKILPATSDFTMTTNPNWAGFVNHHPMPGEPAVFSRPEHPLSKDYAVIALLPGVEQGHQILVFSGLTTLGTEAAVEFACRPASAAILQHAIGSGTDPHLFEALLEVSISGGVPLQTRLVSIRVH
jgi:hypothetical protein